MSPGVGVGAVVVEEVGAAETLGRHPRLAFLQAAVGEEVEEAGEGAAQRSEQPAGRGFAESAASGPLSG